MPVQLLVMCPECGRPQLAAPASLCVSCGAKLPERPATKAERANGRDRLLDAYEPFMEMNAGGGRRLLLSERRLEWHPAQPASPLLVDLTDLKAVRLQTRPVWESLPFGAFGVLWIFLASPWPARVLGGLLALLAIAACLLQRRAFLVLERGAAEQVRIPLAMGRPRSELLQRVESIWGSLQAELQRLGVHAE